MRRLSGGSPGGRMASRLRLRRMVSFLKDQGFNAAARELEGETGLFFDAAYMERLMRMGSWDKADGYLQHFLPTPEHASPQSLSLVMHLRSAWTLAVVAGGPDAADFASHFDGLKGPIASDFRHVLHKMHADQPRASMLWRKMAPSAVDTALDLLAKCPELKGKLHLPRDRPMPWEVIPLIGARGLPRHRSSKPANRTPADVVARALKRQKRLLSTLETDAYSECARNASANSSVLKTQMEQNAPKPIALDEMMSHASFTGDIKSIERPNI